MDGLKGFAVWSEGGTGFAGNTGAGTGGDGLKKKASGEELGHFCVSCASGFIG